MSRTEIKELLDTEIRSEIEFLSSVDIGTDTYKSTVEGITKLMDRRNEMDKIDLEETKQRISEETESKKDAKEKELNEYNKRDQLIKHAISIGSIVIPVLLTVWGTYKTLKFEETGTVTTIMGRGFVNKLIPKK